MKNLVKIIGILLVACFVAAFLTACNFDIQGAVDDIINNQVFKYSQTGENEIAINFAAINSDKYKGINEWEIRIYELDTEVIYNLKYYADKAGETPKEKHVLSYGDIVISYIKNGENQYYVNETAGRAYIGSTAENAALAEGDSGADFTLLDKMIKLCKDYCIISLDGWDFVKKNDNRSITYKEQPYDTVEYEYKKATAKMQVNFKKIALPVILRTKYDLFAGQDIVKTIDIYTTLHTEEVSENDFSVLSKKVEIIK